MAERRWDPVIPRCTAATLGVLGALCLLLAWQVASGAIPWDVKGHLLRGGELALFVAAIVLIGLLGLTAAAGVWLGRRWGRLAALVFWATVGLVAGGTDRLVEGAGEPLWTYAVYLTLVPSAATAALLWLPPPSRRFFAR